jgi:cation-transporting ATPase I
LRAVESPLQQAYVESALSALRGLEGVETVTCLLGVGRVVVVFNRERVSLDEIIETLDDAEVALAVDDRPFGTRRTDHPADIEPVDSDLLMIATDVASLGVAGVGRLLHLPVAPVQLDVTALLTVVSYVPWLRAMVEERLQSPAAGVGLAMARAVSGGLGQQVSGPAIDVLHRGTHMVAMANRRSAWRRLEGDLVDRYSATELGSLVRDPRPGDLPRGPIERVSVPTTLAAFSGAGLGMLLRPNLDQAISLLVAGAPKAARWGREAYASQLSSLLSGRDLLVIDPGCLEKLDRIDALVIEGGLLAETKGKRLQLDPLGNELLNQAETAGVEVWVATEDRDSFGRLAIAGTVGSGFEAAESVRRMQRLGKGVAVVTAGEHAALSAADVGLGLRCIDRPLPWSADIIGRDSIADGYLLLVAIETAKRNASHAAGLAVAGTGVAGLMALGALYPGGIRRVMGAVNISALIAHLNGMRLATTVGGVPIPVPPPITDFHARTFSQVMSDLGSSPQGLTDEEVGARLTQPLPAPGSAAEFFKATAAELANPLTPILGAGAGLAAAAGTLGDAAAVAGVMGISALLGGFQRYRAERVTRELLERTRSAVTVIRDGSPVSVDNDSLVEGDIVHLQAGEVVPADCRLVSANVLEVDESNLTGESMPVPKSVDPVDLEAPVSERSSMLYAGTMIAAGSAEGIVVAEGTKTEALHGLSSSWGAPPDTGVEQRLEKLTARISPISVSSGLAIVGSGLARGIETSQVLGSGVGIAVAAVPESLPLLATAAQQSAARRLSSRGVVVRNPRAIEALGRVDVVCADKTGTLTIGKIRVDCITDQSGGVQPLDSLSAAHRRVLAVTRAATPDPEKGRRLAHPTDRAIIYAVEEADLDWHNELGHWSNGFDLPFEPSRGYHASVGVSSHGSLICVKGAPEVVIPRCSTILGPDDERRSLTVRERRRFERTLESLAHRGLRVLVVAEKASNGSVSLDGGDIRELTLLGAIGLNDPVRPRAAQAIDDLRVSQIRVLMITGDHPATAIGVATELGLEVGSGVLTGTEIDELEDSELAERLEETDVCARVTPTHKVRIVRALRQSGRVVAMTGDGANDAPAIRLADVGIALGTRATDAARSASDLVIVDDSIETIVSAVVEGRALWKSVRDAVSILVGGNLGEVAFTLLGSLPSGVAPLNARQLLLVNLMTDALPAMAVAVSRPPDRSPRDLLHEGPDQALGRELDEAIVLRAVTTGLGAAGGWLSARVTGRRKRAGTTALVSLVGTELGQTIASSWRSPLVVGSSVLSFATLGGIVQTPGLSQMFGCTPLGPLAWMQAMTSAGLATAGSLVAPGVLDRFVPAGENCHRRLMLTHRESKSLEAGG